MAVHRHVAAMVLIRLISVVVALATLKGGVPKNTADLALRTTVAAAAAVAVSIVATTAMVLAVLAAMALAVLAAMQVKR